MFGDVTIQFVHCERANNAHIQSRDTLVRKPRVKKRPSRDEESLTLSGFSNGNVHLLLGGSNSIFVCRFCEHFAKKRGWTDINVH